MRALYGACCAMFWIVVMGWAFSEGVSFDISSDVIFLSIALAFAGGCAGGA